MIKFDSYIVDDETDPRSIIYVDVCNQHERSVSREAKNMLKKDEVLPEIGEDYVDCGVFGCRSDKPDVPRKAQVRLVIPKSFQRLFKFL